MLKSQIQKIESITPDVMIVGIDVAKKKHWARIFDYRGLELTKGFSFKNNIDGFNRLSREIRRNKERERPRKNNSWYGANGALLESIGMVFKGTGSDGSTG